MIARLVKPWTVAVVGLLIGAAAGLGWYWFQAVNLLASARVHRAPVSALLKFKTWDVWTVEIDNAAKELKEEKERLRKESDQLDLRAARLTAEREQIEKLRVDIDAMRTEITERLVEVKAGEMKNLRTLAQDYTNISPKAAVAIFRELDDVTAVKILSLMKPEIIGPIFEQMSLGGTEDAKRAATLSEKLRLTTSEKTAQSP
jgi:flagellar motility protein MotE (MotC chaperone)